MPKPPYKETSQTTTEGERLQSNTRDALNWLGTRTLDDIGDGKLYRGLLGVNADNLLTNSGIASETITGDKLADGTVTGTQIAAATVAVSNLAPCNQFNVYRDAAFTMPAGAYSALYANKTVKDTGNGWSSTEAVYTLPASGDWQFSWSMATSASANAGKEFVSALVVNSGLVFGSVAWSTAASQYHGSVGTYLYMNGRTGDRVKVQFFNGDSSNLAMSVASGGNFFCGYQVR